MMVRVSLEEAIKQSSDWNEFLSEHEKRYAGKFSDCLRQIKEELGF